MKEKQRVNITVSKEVYEFFKNGASDMGVSMSAYMALALNEYMKQQVVSSQLPQLMEMYESLRVQGKVE